MNQQTTQTYTDSQLREKLAEIANKSELIPNSIVKKSEKFSGEKLEKLLLIINQAFEKEKSLSKEEKDKVMESLKQISKDNLNLMHEKFNEFLAKEDKAQKEKDSTEADKILAQI